MRTPVFSVPAHVFLHISRGQRIQYGAGSIQSCTRGGDCERKCPYGLPIVEMLQAQLGEMEAMMGVYEEVLGR